MDLDFKEITPHNWRKINSLEVGENQKEFVASNTAILARAFAYRRHNSRVHVVYRGDNPIGLIMEREYIYKGDRICILDQFMIDKNYQAKGFGREAMIKWLLMVKARKNYGLIMLSYMEENIAAEKMYESLGFIPRPKEEDEDELLMVYKL